MGLAESEPSVEEALAARAVHLVAREAFLINNALDSVDGRRVVFLRFFP